MKLDRNINPDGRGKYAIVKMRVLAHFERARIEEVRAAFDTLRRLGIIELGNTPDTEFFLIKLRDKYAPAALIAYAAAASADDPEYAAEVHELAERARLHPNKRQPD